MWLGRTLLLPGIGIRYIAETYATSLTDNQCVKKTNSQQKKTPQNSTLFMSMLYMEKLMLKSDEYSQTEMSQEQLLEQIDKISNKLAIGSEVHNISERTYNCSTCKSGMSLS